MWTCPQSDQGNGKTLLSVGIVSSLSLLSRSLYGVHDIVFGRRQERLRTAYVSVVHALGREGIMHLQAEAGVFLMLDLREFLEDSSMVSGCAHAINYRAPSATRGRIVSSPKRVKRLLSSLF